MADMQPTPEEWRPIPGYEGLYEVTASGRVRSLDRVIRDRVGTVRPIHGRELATRVGDTGYWVVSLTKDKKTRSVRLHRILFEAFVGPIPDGEIIRHLNDVRTDNRLENLAVGTTSDNMYDRVRNGIHYHANRTECPQGHPYDEANTRYMQPGNRRYCGECHRIKSKAWKDANREKVRAANREYMRTYNARKRTA